MILTQWATGGGACDFVLRTCDDNEAVPRGPHWELHGFRNPVMYTGSDGLQFKSLIVFA